MSSLSGGLDDPAASSYIAARDANAWFSGGAETATVGLVAACATICPSVSGSTSLLFLGTTLMWILLRFSSLPVGVVTAYDRGTSTNFSFSSAGFHFSVA